MKAAVVPEFKAPLEIRDVAVPEPGPGQVLVRIEASGLCHTDIHAAHGDWPVKPKMPLIPGHELAGVVEDAFSAAPPSRADSSSMPCRSPPPPANEADACRPRSRPDQPSRPPR